ncbi:MAG: tail protein X [Candidatus Devosia phytovorans]|uniref:Tail protein X n=1 Tax=Candidatus Devosia phytovorans TaxID=3121372 RepID=A0AAJ5VUX3_9HYPH|nr:tail protein X [Devosia sp.]WEK04576.1 MAG: tail protein X [Devosia sp.]
MITVTVKRGRTSIDLLLWQQHGIAGSALLERTLAENPGLAGLGPELPIGTVVKLLEAPPPRRGQTLKVIDLFGES